MSGCLREFSTAQRCAFTTPGSTRGISFWIDPLRQYYARQIGRAKGADIVQIGKNDAGAAIRWTFTDITPDAFRWVGERSLDDEATWQLQAEFLARRRTT